MYVVIYYLYENAAFAASSYIISTNKAFNNKSYKSWANADLKACIREKRNAWNKYYYYSSS